MIAFSEFTYRTVRLSTRVHLRLMVVNRAVVQASVFQYDAHAVTKAYGITLDPTEIIALHEALAALVECPAAGEPSPASE